MKIQSLLIAAIAALAIQPALASEHDAETAGCGIIDITVYFASNETMLSDAATRAIQVEAARADGCEIARIEASAMAGDAADDALAKDIADARTQAVINGLIDAGLNAPFGDAVTSQKTDGVRQAETATPLARRVEVTLTPLSELNS
ncbi:MAG: hypothetical protein AAGK23_03415 [Pseudomonadota bacterium]